MRRGSLTYLLHWRNTRSPRSQSPLPLPTGEVFTGYFSMSTMDKALAATNIQADATLDAICANGQRIQQAWEDNAEDERG